MLWATNPAPMASGSKRHKALIAIVTVVVLVLVIATAIAIVIRRGGPYHLVTSY